MASVLKRLKKGAALLTSSHSTFPVHRVGLRFGLDGTLAGGRGQEAQVGPVTVHAIHAHVVDCVWQVAQGKEADYFRYKSLEEKRKYHDQPLGFLCAEGSNSGYTVA